MDLHQLQAFDQIVLQGNFSKAARRLDISQPTISLRIQVLEQEIGGALFIRGGSRLSLTELGRNFLPYAQAALRAMTTGVEVAQQTIQGNRGRVVIGTLPSLATGFFAAMLARLHQAHPHLDLIVHTGHTQQIAEMLYDGYVQIGFVVGPFFHPEMTPLLHIQEPLIIVTHAQHPLATHKQITTTDLEELGNPFFSIDWSIEVKQWQTQVVIKKGPVVEVPPQTALDMLRQGMGTALLTHSLVHEDLKTGRLVKVAVQGMVPLQRESVLIRLHGDQPLPAATNEFLRIFREEARDYCLA